MNSWGTGKARVAACVLALIGVAPASLVGGMPVSAQSGSLDAGCTAWGTDLAGPTVGPTRCRWEVDQPAGAYAVGDYIVRVYRDGRLVWPTDGDRHPVGCFPGTTEPLYGQPFFLPGDVVEVEIQSGFVHVGPLGGIVC